METLVGPERIAFPCEHARWVFTFALEREHTRRVRIGTRYVVQHHPLQDFAVVLVARQCHFADACTGQGSAGQLGTVFLLSCLASAAVDRGFLRMRVHKLQTQLGVASLTCLADLIEDEKHGPVTPMLIDVCDSYITLQVGVAAWAMRA